MARTDFLTDLIQSLSKSEKRYFKLYASRYRHSGEKKYLGIFRVLEKEKSKASSEQISREADSRNPASDKHYLSEMLMASLRQFHAESTLSMRLENELLSVELLFNKGLFIHALQKLLRVKKEALRTEMHQLLLRIIGLERDIRYLGNINWREESDKLFAEEEQVLSHIASLAAINRKRTELFRISLEQGKPKTAQEQQRWDELMAALDPDQSQTGLLTETSQRMRAWAHALFMLQRFDEANTMNRRRRNFFRQHPQLIGKNPKEYIIHCFLHVSTSTKAGHYDEADKLLEEIRKLRKQYNENTSPAIAAEIDERLINTEIYLYGKSGRHDLICAMEDRAEKYFREMRTDAIGMFAFNLATAFMLSRNYRKAIRWTNRVISDPSGRNHHIVYMSSMYMQAAVHIALGDPDVALSLVNSAKRYVKTRRAEPGIEPHILDMLRRCADVQFESERSEIARAFLRTSMQDPLYAQQEEYQALHAWIVSLSSTEKSPG